MNTVAVLLVLFSFATAPANETVDGETNDTLIHIPANDSIRVLSSPEKPAQPVNAEAAVSQRPIRTDVAGSDTTRHFLIPHWGFGAGWTLGGIPAFPLWQSGLPDSLTDFSIPRTLYNSDFGLSDSVSDSMSVRFSIREKPAAYNVSFPIYLTLTPFVAETWRLSLESSFGFARKKFIGSLQADSTRHQVFMEDALNCFWVSLGASYTHAISPEYFTIAGVSQSGFVTGFSIRPLTALFRTSSIRGNGAPELVSYLSTAAQEALGHFRSFGMGVSWRAGISGLRTLTPQSGMEIGLYYVGDWSGAFGSDGTPLTRGRLNPNGAKPEKRLSYLSHMAELRIILLRAGGD